VSDIEPGWYRDPAEPTTQRYWDGEGWLGEPLPIDAVPPEGPPPTPPPTPEVLPGPASPVAEAGDAGGPDTPAGTTSQPGPPETPETPGSGWPPGAWPPGGVWPPNPAWPPGSPPPPGSAMPPGGTPPAGTTQPGPGGALPQGVVLPPGWQYAIPHPGLLPGAFPAPRPHGLTLAHSGARLLARMIDIFVVLVLNVVVNGWFVYEYVKEISPVVREIWRRSLANNRSTEGLAFSDRASYLMIVIVVLAAALWFAYEVPAVANTGQTLGKRLLGIRVVTADGGPIGFLRSIQRWIPQGAPLLLWGLLFPVQLLDAAWCLWDKPRRQCLHDKAARTIVVNAPSQRP
jgi:uncharacterized RDD family membrane protein YckC